MSSYEKMIQQYQKNTSSTGNSGTSKPKFNLANYFSTYLEDKVNSATRKIRILPTKDGSSPFVEIMGHKAKLDGQWKTFACLKHMKNLPCPFCEARELLLATGEATDKEQAKQYSARKMYVVKLIDRDKEDEGVKFWRFNHDYRKTGTFDKINGILVAVGSDISDAKEGRDLMINIARDTNNKPVIQSIVHTDKSPLSTDETKVTMWLEDDRTWESVYSVKPYAYLEIIVRGGNPVWDKVKEAYVDKDSIEKEKKENENAQLEAELKMGQPKTTQAPVTTTTPVTADMGDMDNEEIDLPF